MSAAARPPQGLARGRARVSIVVLHSEPAVEADRRAHYYVDAAGAITPLVPENRVARHSGSAVWRRRRRNIDGISIGITVAQTPGAPYTAEQVAALREIVGGLRARHGIDERALFRWEGETPGQPGPGVIVPLPLPLALDLARPAAAAPMMLALAEVQEEEVQCEPPMLRVVAAEAIRSAANDWAAGVRLWSFLQGEAYSRRGEGFTAQWSFHQHASALNLGAPLAHGAPEPARIRWNNKIYNYQVFARDTVYNEVPLWSQVEDLGEALGGRIPASGLARLLLEASYRDSGGALHPDWSFHTVAVRDGLGSPLGGSYIIAVAGHEYAIQVFSCDTLYTPIGVPRETTDWSDVRRLSAAPAGALREQLWGETYKPSGSPYDASSSFHALAMQERLGAPLSDIYGVEHEGNGYLVQIFALDTLFAGPDGVVKRQSSLPKPDFVLPVPTFDPLSDQRPTFDILPLKANLPSTPRISQFFGYTRFAAGTRFSPDLGTRNLYANTQGRHSGIDFGVPLGTQLLSVGRGIVLSTSGALFGAGPNSIIVRYGAVYALYGHIQRAYVQPGQVVNPGEILGESGYPKAPHLHFEIRPVPVGRLQDRNPNQTVENPLHAVNPVDFFGPQLQSYFDWQLTNQQSGASRHFCVGGLHDQPDMHSFGPVDTRPCSN